MAPGLFAVQHIRRMRGGTQSQLMRASDGRLYVVKFQNNPQHSRVLANELIATRLAEHIGLPVPACAVIEVDERLIRSTPDLTIELPRGKLPFAAGLQFASQFITGPAVRAFDFLPGTVLNEVRQLGVFAGALVLDKWLGNTDWRQVVFWREGRGRKYRITLIDHGHCFNSDHWDFPDSPLHGRYVKDEVYACLTGWDSFEPWLSNAEGISEDVVWQIVASVPAEWYGADNIAIARLASAIWERRTRIRALIAAFCKCASIPLTTRIAWRAGQRGSVSACPSVFGTRSYMERVRRRVAVVSQPGSRSGP